MATVLLAVVAIGGCGQPNGSAEPSVVPPSAETPTPMWLREEHIAEATAFRSRFGLRDDREFVEAIATRPDAQAAIPEFGIPLLPEEVSDLMSRRWDLDLLTLVRGYGELFPEDFAGAYVNLESSGVTVAFTDQIERHRSSLSNLVPAGSVVDIREVRWTLDDLSDFVDAVEVQAAWFESAGISFDAGADILENVVDVRFRGPEEAARRIEDHFGRPDWLRVRWAGAAPWNGPRGDLTIRVVDFNARPMPNVWCEFQPVDERIEASSETIWGTDASGVCEIPNLPAVVYHVRLHRWVDNDHYDPVPISEFRIELMPGGTTAEVAIPCQALSDECAGP